MKKILLSAVFTAITLTTFVSCSSDDGGSAPVEVVDSELKKELIGEWRITHFFLSDRNMYVNITVPPFNTIIDENYITFRKDDTFSSIGSLTYGESGWYTAKDIYVELFREKTMKNDSKIAIIKVLNSESDKVKEVALQVGDVIQKLKITKQ